MLSIVFESLTFSVFSLGPVCMLASDIMIRTRKPPSEFELCTYFCYLYKPVGYTLMDESRFMPESYLAFHRKGAGRLCKTSTSKTVSAKLSKAWKAGRQSGMQGQVISDRNPKECDSRLGWSG